MQALEIVSFGVKHLFCEIYSLEMELEKSGKKIHLKT